MLDVFDEMKEIARALEGGGISYALVGGLAVSIYARPRATEDVDLLLSPEDLARCSRLLEPLGFRELARPMTFDGGELVIRRFVKLAGEDFLVLDLLLAMTEELRGILSERVRVEAAGQTLWLASVEGLRALKRRRGSPQDLADLEALDHPEGAG